MVFFFYLKLATIFAHCVCTVHCQGMALVCASESNNKIIHNLLFMPQIVANFKIL